MIVKDVIEYLKKIGLSEQDYMVSLLKEPLEQS